MTQDEIIEMANKAYAIDDGKPLHPSALFHLEIFAKLVAAKAFQEGYSIGESAGFKEGIKLERKTRGEA